MAYQAHNVTSIRGARARRRATARRRLAGVMVMAALLGVFGRGVWALAVDAKPAMLGALAWARGCR